MVHNKGFFFSHKTQISNYNLINLVATVFRRVGEEVILDGSTLVIHWYNYTDSKHFLLIFVYAFLKVPEQFLAIEGDCLSSNITPMQMLPHKQKRWVHGCICRGKSRLSHLIAVGSHLQHFVPSILLVSKVQKVKHTGKMGNLLILCTICNHRVTSASLRDKGCVPMLLPMVRS